MMTLDGQPWTPPPVISQKMAGRFTKWWCKSHGRLANHISIRLGSRNIVVTCDPYLGGIMIPCECKRVQQK